MHEKKMAWSREPIPAIGGKPPSLVSVDMLVFPEGPSPPNTPPLVGVKVPGVVEPGVPVVGVKVLGAVEPGVPVAGVKVPGGVDPGVPVVGVKVLGGVELGVVVGVVLLLGVEVLVPAALGIAG